MTLRQGERSVVQLELPGAASRASGLSPLVPIGFGAAGAGLVVGVITAVMSLDCAQAVKGGCFEGRLCPRSLEDTRDESVVLAHVATGSFVFAGAGVLAGVIGLALGGRGGGHARARTAGRRRRLRQRILNADPA